MEKKTFLFKEESYLIQGAIFEVYKEMGPGFLEAVYQECLEKELMRQNIPYSSQTSLEIRYKDQILMQKYKPDFICFGQIILELKAVQEINSIHIAQVINYLKATGLGLGFIINFGHYPKVEIKRLVL
ncbi:hypothetical protein LNTAR_00375 [Lentisphaera araneosa HTCC2155]|uniref:GTP-binding signal recognition particle n=1 Tax=Lentisphaera araneosa HTCC2155 TaxID=313628 RepID=A6DKB2_9BACT|nr:GxxExxY protein [Lentisphaera araneosa]EDM27810.1 hypothetical protein LNTAR_00375 [Lentisphaera araneosa HTCC2155]